MTATALPSGLSWEQFLELLDQGDEYEDAELIDGQVVVSTPDWLHQRIVMTLSGFLWTWVRASGGRGEVIHNPRVKITHNRGYLPDVAWYRGDRVRPGAARPDRTPDLAVEVLSPSTRTFDMVRQRGDYARIGVDELWSIDPVGPAARVLRRSGAEVVLVDDLDADGVLTSPMLPGLTISIGELIL